MPRAHPGGDAGHRHHSRGAPADGGRPPDPGLGERIRQAELTFIMGADPRGAVRAEPGPKVAPWGIALSGGGIRSATFSLGVLQALAENGLLRCFHYQSTISGGGYAGAFLQGLIRRKGFVGAYAVLASHVGKEELQKPILHLREYSNYLSPRKKLLSGDTLGMVGTYVRNVVLIQIQLFALMVALSLLPLLLYPYLAMLGREPWATVCLAGAGLCAVIAAALLELISRHAGATVVHPPGDLQPNPLGGPQAEQPDQKVLGQALAIVYLVAAGAVLAALGLWLKHPSTRALDLHVSSTISACYLAVWALWLVKAFLERRGTAPSSPDERQARSGHPFIRFLAATVAAAALAGPILGALRAFGSRWFGDNPLAIVTLGPSCVLGAVMLTGIVHVGLAGSALTDLQREMWARVAGKAVATVLSLGLTLAMVIYGPWLMRAILTLAVGLHAAAWLSTATWIITTGAGVLAAHSQKISGSRARSSVLELVARVAPVVFLVGLLIGVSLVTQMVLGGVLQAGCAAGCSAAQYQANLKALADQGGLFIPVAFAGMLAVWALFGFAVDLNEFSMNAFYRNRLVRCYLGASRCRRIPEPTTNFDPNDDMMLAEVVQEHRDENNTRPLYPLIGTTLNLVDTKQLDWQDRKAASFLFTPGYCGYVPPPSHPRATAIGDGCIPGISCIANAAVCKDDTLLANRIRLGSAVAISGAAVSPNMGYHSSPAVTLLLTLFDARLGWWLPNPNSGQRKRAPQITFYGEWLIREMLGRTREEGDFIYLSDGGHFENLGIYELVRRQCEFILCVDSSADPNRDFADLGNAIQKCRTDFGHDIDIDVSDLRCGADGVSGRSCAVGRIRYKRPDDSDAGEPAPSLAGGAIRPTEKTGVLFYIKPSMTGRESADIAYYARMHPSFPHESTTDQYFDEAQFECYRRLGRNIASAAFEKVIERARAEDDGALRGADGFRLGESDLKASFLRELQSQWIAPLKGMDEHFSQHAHVMASLFAKLRREPALSALDAHLYPAWNDITHGMPTQEPGELTALPEGDDFRACFYFCQELVQLMQSVYHDLDLEKAWDHPDNRGWMNAFRQWSWSPVFRIAWVVGSPTYGKPFVTFCELRLGLPALEQQAFTTIEVCRLAPGSSWRQACDALLTGRRINRLEYGILGSSVLADVVADSRGNERHIFLLRLKWSAVTVRNHCPLSDSTVGVAVLVDGKLRVLRVQDHMRQMGLASVFIRHIVESGVRFDGVRIRPGAYGEVGDYSDEQAALYTRRLNAMLRHAQSSGSR